MRKVHLLVFEGPSSYISVLVFTGFDFLLTFNS